MGAYFSSYEYVTVSGEWEPAAQVEEPEKMTTDVPQLDEADVSILLQLRS